MKKTITKIEAGVHYFNVEEAKKYGIEKATMIYNLRYWLKINMANNNNIHSKDNKSYYWSFNSISALKEIFPYFSESSMQRWFKELEKDGVVITGIFNKLKYDKTKWYTLPEFEIVDDPTQIDECITQNDESINQIGETIPDNKPKIENTDIISKEKENFLIIGELTLPIEWGKSTVTRLLYFYRKNYYNKYETALPTALYGRIGKTIKELLISYSEIQLAYLMMVFFEWKGMDGGNNRELDFFSSNGFNIGLFRTNINKFEIYVKNVCGYKKEFNSSDDLLRLVVEHFNNL